MDAHLFRRFTRELVPLLAGARLVKIQEPFENIHTFSLDLFVRSADRKVQLVLKSGRKEPFLFLAKSRISANSTPSAEVMRLRKYAAGRRILSLVPDFAERRLWLLLHGDADPIVYYSDSEAMYERLRTCGYDAQLVRVTNAPHEGTFWSLPLLEHIFAFIQARIG